MNTLLGVVNTLLGSEYTTGVRLLYQCKVNNMRTEEGNNLKKVKLLVCCSH